ncbi:ras GTPase-activating-like protein IQGAP2 isoform X2 [Bolinopsis microptera]|uniref:ras GTPase-activating-like protein IQGAP2 isoform X2 n=1 Tax=Bolinopsis microptera TaxID=2820187 RepID=UPI0030791C3D
MTETDGSTQLFGGVANVRAKTQNIHDTPRFYDGEENGVDDRITADNMDEARQQNMAYEYLCHLEEAKNWIEACIEEDLGPTMDIEEALRNGVILAKLGHYFAPEIVTKKRIYDPDLERFNVRGLHFKHTDNINYWMRAMASIGLPQIFFPTTPDLYDKKNMPKVIYCIHALSIWLSKLGKAPNIENLLGIAEFTEEDITEMRRALEDYGISIPAFNKIGGILEKEIGVDEAGKHAAVIVINEILQKEDPEVTLKALNNKKAYLNYIEIPNSVRYHEILFLAKLDKTETALEEGKTSEESDIYEFYLTHTEIQDIIDDINDIVRKEIAESKFRAAIAEINRCAMGDCAQTLLAALQVTASRLKNVNDLNYDLYLEFLKAAKLSKEGNLNVDEIQEVLELANEEMRKRRDLEGALKALHENFLASNIDGTFEALHHVAFKLPTLHKNAAPKYQATLFFELAKLQDRAEKEAEKEGVELEEPITIRLTHANIQDCIKAVNNQLKEVRRFAEAIANINGCLVQDDPQETLGALHVQAAGIKEVLERCADDYHVWIKEGISVKKTESEIAEGDSSWIEMRSPDNQIFFYNPESKELVWVKPEGASEVSHYMAQDEIQWIVSRVTAKRLRDEWFDTNVDAVVRLQSIARMSMARKRFKARLKFLHENEEAALRIQCLWRGYLIRKELKARRDYLNANMRHIIRIQAWVRGYQIRKNYLQLTQDKPSVQVLYKFLYLLDQSAVDHAEEAELRKHKASIVKEIRHNQQLEKEINEMDIKIGLLVKNRLTLSDVVTASKKLKKGGEVVPKNRGLKELSKESREMLESYQHLFYLLQTNPKYLAKLLFTMPQNNCTKFMESVVLTIYNYGTNSREECLLLRLFENALKEEVQRKVDKVQDISTGSPTVIKIVVGYYRGTQGNQNSLKSLLGPLIEQVMEDSDLNMNIHPLEVYKAWISRTEMETGEASKLPYDVTPEQALKHKEVTDEIENTIKKLVTIIKSFQEKIIGTVDQMPYGIRYMAMCLRKNLKEKFPESSEEEILKAVGNLLYYRYMNPVITAPDSFEVIELGAGSNMNNVQRRNLGSIAKILQHAASFKIFDSDARYLASLNSFIKTAYIKFMEFFDAASTISDIDEHFNMDEFSDVTMLNKPMIFISPSEINSTHQLLLDHQKQVTEADDDPMNEVLASLGPIPEDEAMLGDKSTEFGLVLTNKWELNMSDESNIQALFSKTKYLIVDLLKIQRGETFTAILHTDANKQQQELYKAIHSRRLAAENEKTNEEEKNSKMALFDPNDNTIKKLKEHILKNLTILEQHKLVTPTEDYQEILTSIAKDICNQRKYRQRRKQDLKKIGETVERMSKKKKYYGEAVTYYQEYVKACVNNLSKGGKSKKGDRRKTARYSAHKLYEKGVLVEIEKVPTSSFKAVTIEFSSTDQVGVFEVSGKLSGFNIDKINVVFENLLQVRGLRKLATASIRRSVHVKVRGLRGGNQREPSHIPSQQEVLRSGVTRYTSRRESLKST